VEERCRHDFRDGVERYLEHKINGFEKGGYAPNALVSPMYYAGLISSLSSKYAECNRTSKNTGTVAEAVEKDLGVGTMA
jgi:hypothetical protein